MIHSITSDLDGFKSLTFGPGLNVLLAERCASASDRQSRNGVGKTSFIELIHFLFGGNIEKDSIFKTHALCASLFEMQADIGDRVITASRSVAKHSSIRIQGDTSSWPIKPRFDTKTGGFTLSNKRWKDVLGALQFSIPVASNGQGRFSPTFRSLFPYFARRQNSGGFVQPTQQSQQQQNWGQQVAISYLLGLDSSISEAFQQVRVQEDAACKLRRAVEQGDLGEFYGSTADFRTHLAIADKKAQRLQRQLSTFNVVPEYVAMEREASEITRTISAINDDNMIDRELIDQLTSAFEDERSPVAENLEKLYREAGVVLPGTVGCRFEEVSRFHEAIVRNRQEHLQSEISAAEQRIATRETQRVDLDRRRAQLMGILQSGGALEHYTKLQEEVGRAEASVEALRQQLEVAERIESTKDKLDIERARLRQALQSDLHERSEMVNEAIVRFEELSQALYEQAGSLTIAATPNGPAFEIKIDAQRSKGITNMQIFCFDLMLMELAHHQGIGTGFLIHDSHLFDGVDERQIAKALQLGADRSAKFGFQYIVTMNSDVFPGKGFRRDFEIQNFVNRIRLTDESETGGLFGIRFG